MFNFTSLARSQCTLAASQSLLEFDGGVKILIDVGWDSKFDPSILEPLEQHVPTLSLILLTHATIEHLGAYVYCCKNIPLFAKVPVYATIPVITLGRTLAIDIYESTPRAATSVRSKTLDGSNQLNFEFLLPCPTQDEISEYFNAIHPLKYSQPHQPIGSAAGPPLTGITITAYGAGHTLGGTIWHVQHGLESIVYASDWNQGRESLFNGAAWLSTGGGVTEVIEPLRRPTALICSCRGLGNPGTIPRRRRDELLLALAEENILAGGKTLIPTDSCGRMLELAFLLNSTWRQKLAGVYKDQYSRARVYVASRSARSASRSVSNMLEWIDDGVRAETEATGAAATRNGIDGLVDPLDWKYVRFLETPGQVRRAMQRSDPCVILASDTSLEWGLSRTAFECLSKSPENLVIMTRTGSGVHESSESLRTKLWDIWQTQEGTALSKNSAKVVMIEKSALPAHQVSLTGLSSSEEVSYRQFMAHQQQLMNAVDGAPLRDAGIVADGMDDQDSDSSDSDSEAEGEESEQQGRTMNLSAQITQTNRKRVGLSDSELGINVLIRSKSIHDVNVRDKRGREKIFPLAWQKTRRDEFGELIKAESYLRAEERDDIEGVDLRSTKQDEVTMGNKRRWDDVGNAQKSKRNKGTIVNPQISEAVTGSKTAIDERADADSRDHDIDVSDDSDYDPEAESSRGPQKIEITEKTTESTVQLTYVDFEGLQERRDLQMLIPLIQPRKLILIAGDSGERQAFAETCRDLLHSNGETDISAPSLGETVTASVNTNSWSLRLSQPLVKRLIWQRVKGLGVVALTGKLTTALSQPKQESPPVAKKAKLIAESGVIEADLDIANGLVLDLVKPQSAGVNVQQKTAQSVHVGDLRLAALRQLVMASGHVAEFKGEGILLVDGSVIVRKLASGKIEIEAATGGLGAPLQRTKETQGSFYAVRQLVYNGLAVVSGA